MTWTNVADNEVDTGSPVTTALVTALRENPKAIANAEPGAPRIVPMALGVPITAGATRRYYDSAAHVQVGGSEGVHHVFTFQIAGPGGSVRLKLQHRETSNGDSTVTVKVDGVTQATWTTGSGAWQWRSVDLTLGAMSTITIVAETSEPPDPPTYCTGEIRRVELLTGGEDITCLAGFAPGKWSYA